MDLTKYVNNLPTTIDELHEFILVGKEKLKAHKAKIKAIDSIHLSSAAREAALLDAQDMANILLDAESKLGELLAAIPKPKFNKPINGSKERTTEKTLPPNITKKESHFAQTIANNPEIVEKVKEKAEKENRIATASEVIKEVKKEKQKTKQQELIESPPPEGKYRTIVIDPPWNIEKILRDVRPYQDEFSYKTMSVEEIKGYPIPCDDNCFLFMWTTQKYLPTSFDILKTWGFSYVLTFVWHKTGGFQPFGLPQYNCEFVVFGKKGSLKFLDTKNFFACFTGKRREHSRKPQEFYETIKRVCPEPRADIFSRESISGFTGFGHEKDLF